MHSKFCSFPTHSWTEMKWKQNYEIIKQLINNHAELIIKNKTKERKYVLHLWVFQLEFGKITKIIFKTNKKIWNFWVFSLEYAKEIITDA